MNGRRRSGRDIFVRFVRTEPLADSALAARVWQLLGEEDGQAPAADRDSVAAQALARMMLAERLGCSPALLRFRSSPRGRPEVVTPPGAARLRFSCAHADGIALCAVAAQRAVGADVESLRAVRRDPLGVAEVVCSPQEIAALRALPSAERAEQLVYLWSRKEAVAKITGFGFHVALARAAARRHLWRLASVRLTDDHVATVALPVVPGEDVHIDLKEAEF